MVKIWIDVEDASGARLGAGPITTALGWRSTRRLDRAGTFSFTMPAADPRAALLQNARVVRCWGVVGGAVTELGAGVVDEVEVTPAADGSVLLSVAGDDIARELAHRSVGFLELTDGAGGPSPNGLAGIMALAPPGWSLDTSSGYGSTTKKIYARFAGESVLEALVKLAEHTGEHFRIGPGRTVTWLRTDQPASGLRAVQGPASPVGLETNPAAVLIQDLSRVSDSYDLVTRLYPYGAGEGQARLNLRPSNDAAPTGYTLSRGQNYLERNDAVATYGLRERYLSFKEIGPVSNTSADLRAASNQLLEAAYQYLRRFGEPHQAYRLRLTGAQRAILPGETIRVVYRRWVEDARTGERFLAVDIDQDLIVLEATTEISQDGLRTTGLVVSTIDRWPAAERDPVVAQMRQGRVYEAHPQMGPNSYVTSYFKHLDATNSATFRFRFGSEVVQLQQILFEFQILPLESTVKSIAGQATTTTAGGGGIATSAQESNGHAHAIIIHADIDGEPVRVMWIGGVAGVFNYATGASSDLNVDTEMNTDVHTHDVTVPAHSHQVTPTITTDYGIFRESAANTFVITDLEYQVNSGGWQDLATAVTQDGSWYQLDITEQLYDPDTFRPLQTSNELEFRRKTSGSFGTRESAAIDGQLSVRNIIQSIAYL